MSDQYPGQVRFDTEVLQVGICQYSICHPIQHFHAINASSISPPIPLSDLVEKKLHSITFVFLPHYHYRTIASHRPWKCFHHHWPFLRVYHMLKNRCLLKSTRMRCFFHRKVESGSQWICLQWLSSDVLFLESNGPQFAEKGNKQVWAELSQAQPTLLAAKA